MREDILLCKTTAKKEEMSPWKCNRRIIFGVTGGIAAYKAPDILRAGGSRTVRWMSSLRALPKVRKSLVLSTLTGRKVGVKDFCRLKRVGRYPTSR